MFLICILISNGLAFGQIKESSIQELRSACEKDLPRSLLADANEAAKLQAKDQISKFVSVFLVPKLLEKMRVISI
ncbi:MAG: hypothetical protein IPK04_20065 [Bdellovibrionales bacterium]|nr:hypothetical protein [Bdellovibrionales bacterium]